MEDSIFLWVVDQSEFQFQEVTLKERELCKDQLEFGLQKNFTNFDTQHTFSIV